MAWLRISLTLISMIETVCDSERALRFSSHRRFRKWNSRLKSDELNEWCRASSNKPISFINFVSSAYIFFTYDLSHLIQLTYATSQTSFHFKIIIHKKIVIISFHTVRESFRKTIVNLMAFLFILEFLAWVLHEAMIFRKKISPKIPRIVFKSRRPKKKKHTHTAWFTLKAYVCSVF